MWPKFPIQRAGVIGCALDGGAARLVQALRKGSRGLTIRRSCRPFEPAGEEAGPDRLRTDAVRMALSEGAFSGRRAVTCLSSDRVHCRHMRLASMPDDELASAVRWQTAKELGWPIDGFCSDFHDAGEIVESGKRRREVISIAASNEDLRTHVGLLETAGLRVAAVDERSCAMARCLQSFAGRAADSCLLIDLSPSEPRLVVIRGGVPRFIRAVPCQQVGVAAQSGQAAAAVDPLLINDLVHEISLCTHYLSENKPDEELPHVGCVIGGGRHEAETASALNEAAVIEFRPAIDFVDPAIRDALEDSADPSPFDAWLLPLGLAMHGCEAALQGAGA